MTLLNDKTVLITGASSGIGAELARQCAAKGARVGLLARREDRLCEVVEQIQSAGGHAAFAVADVCDGQGIHAALDSLAEELQGADILIANAGTGKPVPTHKAPIEDILSIYSINLIGALNSFHWAIPRFVQQGSGHLVGVSSLASFLGLPVSSAYSGSKAALRIHMQSMRLDLAPKGIAVTTICPGFVKSELTDRNRQPMPFMWPTDRACTAMIRAIERDKRQLTFPWPLATALWLGMVLPLALTERLLARFRTL